MKKPVPGFFFPARLRLRLSPTRLGPARRATAARYGLVEFCSAKLTRQLALSKKKCLPLLSLLLGTRCCSAASLLHSHLTGSRTRSTHQLARAKPSRPARRELWAKRAFSWLSLAGSALLYVHPRLIRCPCRFAALQDMKFVRLVEFL